MLWKFLFWSREAGNHFRQQEPYPDISLCVKDVEQHQAEEVKEKQVWKMVWDEKKQNGEGSAEKIAFKGQNFISFEE